jgi:hypothetical protein
MTFPTGKSFSKNVTAIGYTDCDKKPAFKLALHRDGDRWYLYTGLFWHSGFSIIEVTDPANPRFVRTVEGPANTWTLQVQVANGMLVTSSEPLENRWGWHASELLRWRALYLRHRSARGLSGQYPADPGYRGPAQPGRGRPLVDGRPECGCGRNSGPEGRDASRRGLCEG